MKKIIITLTILIGLSGHSAQQVTDLTLVTPTISNAVTFGTTEYSTETLVSLLTFDSGDKAFFNADKDGSGQSVSDGVHTLMTWKTNNLVNIGNQFEMWDNTYSALFNGSSTASSSKSTDGEFSAVKYVGDDDITIDIKFSAYSAGSESEEIWLNILVNNFTVSKSNNRATGWPLSNCSKKIIISQGDVITFTTRVDGTSLSVSGDTNGSFLQIMEQ